MVTKRFKKILPIYLLLLCVVSARIQINTLPFLDNPFGWEANYIVSTLIVIGILFHWGTTIGQRVMHKGIRNYIWAIVALQVLWVTLKNLKWIAFEFAGAEGRLLWYMYYIPMLLIPVCLLLIALSVNKDESYRMNKKWNLIFIPIILLILLVLTNDMHQMVFTFNPNFENWDKGYSYNFAYIIILMVVVLTTTIATITIFRKWRKLDKSKEKLLLVFVSVIAIAYLIIYLVNRPLLSYFVDLTVLNSIICILFLESCIQTGLIRSNNRHQEIFSKADISAQILDEDGKTQYHSTSDTDISKTDFIMLKESKQLMKDENTLSHIAPIHGGYVTWESDITDINKTIKEIEIANKGLYDEVELLKRANEQKEERVRNEKESAVYDAIFAEVRPISEKIKCRIMQSEEAQPEVKKQCLYEISIISAYIKRKINLLLMAETHMTISTEEIAQCFQESFQNLMFYDCVCYLNIVQSHLIEIETAILTYDLFEEVLEKVSYRPKGLFITYDVSDEKTNFAIRVSADTMEDMENITVFERKKLLEKGLCVVVAKEEDEYHISIN